MWFVLATVAFDLVAGRWRIGMPAAYAVAPLGLKFNLLWRRAAFAGGIQKRVVIGGEVEDRRALIGRPCIGCGEHSVVLELGVTPAQKRG